MLRAWGAASPVGVPKHGASELGVPEHRAPGTLQTLGMENPWDSGML